MYYLAFRHIEGFNEFGEPIKGEVVGIGKYDSMLDGTHFPIWSELIADIPGKFMKDWAWENITQPEYETYRDLHGFKEFTTK